MPWPRPRSHPHFLKGDLMTRTKSTSTRIISAILAVITALALIPISAPRANAAALTQNQINIVARADYMYSTMWVCKKTISAWKNQSSFYEGSSYRIPYAWPVTAGKWIGDSTYGITVEQFLKATTDPANEFYTKQSYYSGNSGSYAPYYGSDCSTFVTYCWGLTTRRTTSTLPNAATLIGKVTAQNTRSGLKVGDALNYAGSHVVLVTDITYDADGAVNTIEITEQTPPQLKRTNHTVSSLVSKYGANYNIYRYGGTVPAAPEGSPSAGNDPDSYTPPTTTLSSGASGSEVYWLQASLSQMGYTITVDGKYGNNTAATVSAFQGDYGLTVTGSADAATVARLKDLWANKNGYYYTTASSLNMRTGDGTSHSVITTIPQNSKVAVVGFNAAGTWANIIYNGKMGWVSKSYLSFAGKFNYTLNYNTNAEETLPATSFRHDRTVTVSDPPENEGYVLKGWQLLRASDMSWYNGTAWVADQGSARLYTPGERITFDSSMISTAAGDDSFYLCALWTAPEMIPVTPSEVAPKGYGWQWPAAEAYGFMGNYGGNGQDIELCVDLCLLPSEATSTACFYANGTDKRILIDQSSVTVGAKAVAFQWGELSLSNWHDVKLKILNGTAYVFIDGALVAWDTGYTANEAYQLLFCLTGEMAIDNAMLYSSDSHCFFSVDFENENEAMSLMGDGLGARKNLFADTSDFTLTVTPEENKIVGSGSVSFTATPTAGDGHTYEWVSSDDRLTAYMEGADTNTLTVTIPEGLAEGFTATLTCTAVSAGEKSATVEVLFTYETQPEEVTRGDLDGNGKVNSIDSVLLKKYLAGNLSNAEISVEGADVNGDGTVNLQDAIYLKMRLVGAIS